MSKLFWGINFEEVFVVSVKLINKVIKNLNVPYGIFMFFNDELNI